MIRFQPASDDSLLVYLGERITPEAHNSVLKLLRLLQEQPIADVRDLHPGYHSILIRFDPFSLTHASLQDALQQAIQRLDSIQLPAPRVVKIPVCYGGDLGPDLAELAVVHNLSAEQVIEVHSSVLYSVAFLGFIPGFPYLSGLPENLATPRLSAPRKQVAAGSVGIAGNQTGIYPIATPGGWRLIGRTPLELFRADGEPMSLLGIGDRVRFIPISRERFENMRSA